VESADYARQIERTKTFFEGVDVHALPEIFHYWAGKYVSPLWQEYGFSSATGFFAKYLIESAQRCRAPHPQFASVGAGVCVVEVDVARQLQVAGLSDFTIECIEISGDLLEQGRLAAIDAGVEKHLKFIEADFNLWRPAHAYHGIMVHHALHHVVNLELLYDRVKESLNEAAFFVVADMIGRNGHQRWPEALAHVHRFWHELPQSYRYNHQLKRHEELYENWDCSPEAFEGIRAQDVLPLLIDRFDFRLFIAYANVIDIFVDRCFGHNFDANAEWDRNFIDRVQAFDDTAILAGDLTPTQMLAVMTPGRSDEHHYSRGLAPSRCVHPSR
jgi:hypothetical protein